MSLRDNFRQNRRPKVFSEKITIFTRRVPVENVKTLKTWLWVFSATDNLKNLKLHHMDYNPNMSLWENFRQNRRPKVFSEKRAIFTRRVPGKNCKTLITWLWVFSAADNLKNLKLHDMDYNPNMGLWDNFRQIRRPKVFSEKIAIFRSEEHTSELQSRETISYAVFCLKKKKKKKKMNKRKNKTTTKKTKTTHTTDKQEQWMRE